MAYLKLVFEHCISFHDDLFNLGDASRSININVGVTMKAVERMKFMWTLSWAEIQCFTWSSSSVGKLRFNGSKYLDM